MKKIVGILVCILLIFTILPASAKIIVDKTYDSTISGNTLYVGGSGPGNYTRIQDAIDNASDEDTLFIYSGDYFENIIINKEITIIGEEKKETVIIGISEPCVVKVLSDNVHISNISIHQTYNVIDINNSNILISWKNSNNSIIENTFLDGNIQNSTSHINETNSYGIYVHGSNNFKILNNEIINAKMGIRIYTGIDVLVDNNNILDCESTAIFATSMIWEPRSDNIIISNNTIIGGAIDFIGHKIIVENNYIDGYIGNIGYGVIISSNSYDSVFQYNYVTNCTLGLWSQGKLLIVNNTFINNNLENNPKAAAIQAFSGTRIYYNNFINNGRAILIDKNNDIEVKYNNFIKNTISINFEYNRRIEDDINQPINIIDSNYWGKPYNIPIIIFGSLGIFRIPNPFPDGEVFWLWVYIPWITFDWHPANEPYDIPDIS